MRIGELAARTATTTKTIRYYESIRLLPTPARTDAGYRTYRDDSVRQVQFIRDLQLAGFDLATIGSLLTLADEPPNNRHARDLARDALHQIDDRLARLRRLRAELDE